MGTAENDSMFGRFAEAHIETLSAAQIEQFEQLIEANDNDLQAWASGAKPVPPGKDCEVLRMLRAFLGTS